ncbi:MAG: type III pantothenate kinase [Bernardetiaceae bacterium]|nr:type III pantothenate kinase [Bernardetiaceae bacterium]
MTTLCLDLGNTFGKIRIDQPDKAPIYYRQLDNEAVCQIIEQYYPTHIIYCDVRGTAAELIAATHFKGHLLSFTHHLPIPLKNCYQTPHTLGTDRLAAAVGAWQRFPHQHSLVIDIGTCVTYDFVTATAEFLGGIISPGLQMRLRAMHAFTSKLPLLTADCSHLPPPVIGQNTTDAMLSGAFYGLAAEIQGIICHYRALFESFNILLTGGDALCFDKIIKDVNFVNENMVLDGLKAALDFNLALSKF